MIQEHDRIRKMCRSVDFNIVLVFSFVWILCNDRHGRKNYKFNSTWRCGQENTHTSRNNYKETEIYSGRKSNVQAMRFSDIKRKKTWNGRKKRRLTVHKRSEYTMMCASTEDSLVRIAMACYTNANGKCECERKYLNVNAMGDFTLSIANYNTLLNQLDKKWKFQHD